MKLYGSIRSHSGRRRERGRKEELAERLGYTADRFGGIYSPEGEFVNQWTNGCGYLVFQIGHLSGLVHRFVWHHFNGSIPKHLVIDHIDRDRANAWLYNLRCVTVSENQKNRLIVKRKAQFRS